MSENTVDLGAFIRACATCYPRTVRAQILGADLGIDPARMRADLPAIQAWREILYLLAGSRGEASGVAAITALVREEYPRFPAVPLWTCEVGAASRALRKRLCARYPHAAEAYRLASAIVPPLRLDEQWTAEEIWSEALYEAHLLDRTEDLAALAESRHE